jgi:DNA-binding CsgD family transcriptional regulator
MPARRSPASITSAYSLIHADWKHPRAGSWLKDPGFCPRIHARCTRRVHRPMKARNRAVRTEGFRPWFDPGVGRTAEPGSARGSGRPEPLAEGRGKGAGRASEAPWVQVALIHSDPRVCARVTGILASLRCVQCVRLYPQLGQGMGEVRDAGANLLFLETRVGAMWNGSLRGLLEGFGQPRLVGIVEGCSYADLASWIEAGFQAFLTRPFRRFGVLAQVALAVHSQPEGQGTSPSAGPWPGCPFQGQCPVLSPRDEQVVRLVAEGRMDKEIARELGTTAGVVHKVLHRTFLKLRVGTRTEASWRWHHCQCCPVRATI